MSNDRLASAINNGSARMEAIVAADRKRGLFHVCGFCCNESGAALLSGPICGICEDCAQIAQGFYLVVARDRLKLPQDFDRAWRAAIGDYTRFEGKPPEIKPPSPAGEQQ